MNSFFLILQNNNIRNSEYVKHARESKGLIDKVKIKRLFNRCQNNLNVDIEAGWKRLAASWAELSFN